MEKDIQCKVCDFLRDIINLLQNWLLFIPNKTRKEKIRKIFLSSRTDGEFVFHSKLFIWQTSSKAIYKTFKEYLLLRNCLEQKYVSLKKKLFLPTLGAP